MAQLIKIIGAIAVLLVALIVSAVAVLKSKNFNDYRQFIAEQVKLSTGRDLIIDGNLKLKLSLEPSITVEGVRFANASWGSKPEMASIQRFEAKVKIMPLFSGKIEIVRVVLSGVDALVEISKDGRSNLDFLASADKPPPPGTPGPETFSLPEVHNIEFRDIRLTYVDARSGEKTSIALDRLTAVSRSLVSPVDIEFAGTVNNHQVMAQGTVGAFKSLSDGNEPWPVSLTLSGPGMTVKVDGGVAQPLLATGLDLRVALDAGDPAAAAGLAGIALPDLPRLRLSGLLRDTKAGYRLTGMEVTVGDSEVSGDVAVSLDGIRPSVKAHLASKLITVDEWLGPDGVTASGSGTADGRLFPSDPVPLEGLKAVDADITLKAKRLTAKTLVVTDIDLKLILKGGQLKIAPLRADVVGGRIDTSIDLDSRSATPVLALTFESDGLNVGGLLRDMGVTDILSGAMNIKASLNGSGRSIRALMAGLNGRFSVVGRNGKLNSEALESMSTGVLDVLPWIGKEDTNNINCIVGRFDIVGGKAHSRALVLDTNGITVIGEGTLDLSGERIDMTVDTQAKNASLAKLALPLNIGGTFVAPTVTPSVGRTVIGVVTGTVGTVGSIVKAPISILGSILGGDNAKTALADGPCTQALGALSGRQAPERRSVVQSPPPPKQKQDTGVVDGIGNFGKGLTNSIGDLFGN